MSFHKKKLITLLLIASLLGVANRLFDSSNFNDGLSSINWLYWASLAVLIYLAHYVLTLRCQNPECRKPQIYRGVSLRDWHWPSDKCYSCGSKLKAPEKFGG